MSHSWVLEFREVISDAMNPEGQKGERQYHEIVYYWFRRKSSSSDIHHTYYCCILLNPFVLSFTDHLVLPGPFRGSPQRLLYLHLTLSLGSFSVIPTLCMSSSSALMNLRGFTLFLKPGSSIFKIPLFNISTIPVALTWAVPLTSWFPWLSALK